MEVSTKCAIVVVTMFAMLTHGGIGLGVVDARRNQGSNQRRPSSSSNSGHVTQPSYNSNGNGNGGNSHADVAKLSYPNYNSQPNRPASGANSNANPNPPAAGWNVPQQGPPPAYSASNPAGGGHTNIHEPPPAYHAPNYGAPAPGGNVHQPITATQNQGQQYSGVPPGATYYPAGSHMPAGGGYQPSGGYPSGGLPAGGYPSGGYHPGAAPGGPPPGTTYLQAGSALPPGAVYYPQAPQQSSSGLGFGTGLLAGGLGGALLGHALTPSGGSSSQPVAAAPAAAAGQDRIIIINNGVPVNASDVTTVINANGTAVAPMNATQTDAPPAHLAPFSPTNETMPMANGTDPAAAAAPPPPPPGSIMCVPTKVNETDPADSSKMIEVEKVACFPAPPPPVAAPGAAPVPLAPMATSQPPPPAMLAPDQAAVRSSTSGVSQLVSCQLPLLAGLLGGWLWRLVVVAN